MFKTKTGSTLLASSLLLSGLAVADTQDFQGFYAQLGAGYESIKPVHAESTLTINGADIPVSTTSKSADGAISVISAGWFQALNNRYLLGVGIDFAPFHGPSGTMAVSTQGALPNQNNLVNDYGYKKKSGYNIYVAPAIVVGDAGLAYAKLGYASTKVTKYDSVDYNFGDLSVGLGYRQNFDGGWYGFAEINYADHGNQTETETSLNPAAQGRTLTATATNALETFNLVAGIGVKF